MGLFDILDNKELGDKLRKMADQVKASAKELGDKVPDEWGDKVKGAVESVKAKARELGDKVPDEWSDKAKDAAAQAKEMAGQAKDKAQELSKKMPGGMAGLAGAGVLGLLLLRAMPKGTVQSAGLMGLGAVAWNFYQKWTNKKPETLEIEALSMDDPAAILLVEAMVFAAKADGAIDQFEQERIATMVKHMFPGQNTAALVENITKKDVDPAAIAAQVKSPEQAEDVFRLSCLAIETDMDAERAYLSALAKALNIPDETKLALEREAVEARKKLANMA